MTCIGATPPLELGSPSGLETCATAGGDSQLPILSHDGRFVLFRSTAQNLVLSPDHLPYLLPIPTRFNVFLHDRTAGETRLLSLDSTGRAGGNRDSTPAGISTNGQFVLFESEATNLLPNDTNNVVDVFVHEVATGSTRLVTTATNGGWANRPSINSVMTPDGRYVAFSSSANNLVAIDTNGIADVFLRDLQSAATVLVSVGAKNKPLDSGAPSGSTEPRISADGRYVAFLSTATNLVRGVATSGEVYLRDLLNGTTLQVSAAAHTFIAGSMAAFNLALSADGQVVTFAAAASSSPVRSFLFRYDVPTGHADLVTSNAVPPTGFYRDVEILDMTPDGRFITYVGFPETGGAVNAVFLWDAAAGTTTLVSGNPSGVAPNYSSCDLPLVSASGRYVSFRSTATTLVTNAVSGEYHLYRRDLQTQTTTLIDAGTNGTALSRQLLNVHSMTPDGLLVAFDCGDPDLVANDRNGASDVFVRDLPAGATSLVSAHAPTLSSRTSTPHDLSCRVSLSEDGRYLAYATAANEVLSNCTNRTRNVFVRDFLEGTNLLVSVSTNGLEPANGPCTQPAISGNGRYVVFTSYADNLCALDRNRTGDVILRDLQARTTSLISVNTNGTGPGNASSGYYYHGSPTLISSDGRCVLFTSYATDLAMAAGGTGEWVLRDRAREVSVSWWNTYGPGPAAMTPDGRYVAVAGTPYLNFFSYYVWDTVLGKTIYTNRNALASFCHVAISPDGQRVAILLPSNLDVVDLASGSTNHVSTAGYSTSFCGDGRLLAYIAYNAIAPIDTNRTWDVYLYDCLAHTNLLVSQNSNHTAAANAPSGHPSLSRDGRYLVYESIATDIVPSDANAARDVFLYDVSAGTTTLLSANLDGAGTANLSSHAPVFTGDGQTIVFLSAASDLVEGDFNLTTDIFILRLASTNVVSTFSGQLVYFPALAQPPTLTWPAAQGKSYEVLFKNQLSDPTWQTLNCTPTISNGIATATDPAPSPAHRFYRVVAR